MKISTLTIVAMMSLSAVLNSAEPAPPKQPQSGPGSREYSSEDVLKTRYGEGGTEYWLYEPAKPKPATAPLIVFMHGWTAMQPDGYEGWIRHLVKRGNIVLYPRYQNKILTPPADFLPNTLGALKDALSELKKDGHVKPDPAKFAVVGHSFGGLLAANLAAVAAEHGLPAFKAVMCVEPGSNGFGKHENYAKIPAKTLLLCVVGEDDNIVHDTDAKRIFKQASNLTAENKNLILMHTDRYGKPVLAADHFAPAGFANQWGVDALDYYGCWKWFDALCEAAFSDGKNRKYALGNTPEQRFMGHWSDGKAVKEPTVTYKP